MSKDRKFVNRFKELLEAKNRRDKHNWTQSEISDIVGVSERTLSSYYTNSVAMYRSSTLAAMCEFLGCTIDELLVIEDDEGSEYDHTEDLTPELISA
jgi:DNA-binding Xre family transcriptional regulator